MVACSQSLTDASLAGNPAGGDFEWLLVTQTDKHM